MNTIFSIQPLSEIAHFHKANRNNSPGVHTERYIYILVFNNMISAHSKGKLLMQYKLITVAHRELSLMTVINVWKNTTLSMSDIRTTAAQGTWWAKMMLIPLLLVLIKHTFIKMSHQPKATEYSEEQRHSALCFASRWPDSPS